jgi:hypothetical protein
MEDLFPSHLAEVVFTAFRGLVNSLYRAMPQTRILAIALGDNDPPTIRRYEQFQADPSA